MNLTIKMLLIVVVIFGFSACGDSKSDEEQNFNTTTTESEDNGKKDNHDEEPIAEEITKNTLIHNVSTVSEFRKALEDSALNGQNDTIVLDKGVYKTTEDGLGTFIFRDEEKYNLTIKAKDGLNREDVVLSGDNETQVINLKNSLKDYTFQFFKMKSITIQNGKALASNNSESSIGGLYVDRDIIIENCNVSNNTGKGFQGYSVSLIDSTVSNNGFFRVNEFITSALGGFEASSLIMKNSIISNNKGNRGGGFDAHSAVIIDSTISNNLGLIAGGFKTSTVTIVNSTISENIRGGMLIDGNKGSISEEGQISGDGAGGFLTGTAIVINSTILNNTNIQGYKYYQAGGFTSTAPSIVINSNFINNKIDIHSQGIFINNIFNGEEKNILFLGNSKVLNNYIDYTKLSDLTQNYQIIKKDNFQPTDGVISFENGSNYRLKPTSFGVDIGLNPNSSDFEDLFTDKNQLKLIREYLQTDIDSQSRVSNGVIDLGAYEVQK